MGRASPVLTAATAIVVFATTTLEGSTHYLAAHALRAATLAWLLLTPRAKPLPSFASATALFALAALAVGLLSTERMSPAVDFWATAAFMAAVFLVSAASDTEWRASTIVGFVLAASAHAGWAGVEWALAGARASAGFFNPNYLAAWLALLAVWVWEQGGRWRAVGVPLLLLGTLSTGSRSGMLAWACGTGVVLWTHASRGWRAAGLAAAGALGVAVLVGERVTGGMDRYAFDRIRIWETALKAGWVEPWGWGLGDAPHAFRQLGVALTHGPVRFPKHASHAHSELLQLWVELGVLAILVIVLAWVSLSTLRPARRSALLLAVSLPPVLVGGPLHVPIYALTLALLLGAEVGEERPGAMRWAPRLVVPVATLAFALALPGNLSRLLQEQAARARDRGALDTALLRAEWAQRVAPFDLGASLLVASLRYQRSADAQGALESLYTLSERFPAEPAPADRAERLLRAWPASPERDRSIAVALRTQLDRAPHAAPTWVRYAETLQRLGREDESLAALVRATEAEPNCARALVHLAQRSPDPDRARTLAARALRAHRQARHYVGYPRAVLELPPELEAQARALAPHALDTPATDRRISPL